MLENQVIVESATGHLISVVVAVALLLLGLFLIGFSLWWWPATRSPMDARSGPVRPAVPLSYEPSDEPDQTDLVLSLALQRPLPLPLGQITGASLPSAETEPEPELEPEPVPVVEQFEEHLRVVTAVLAARPVELQGVVPTDPSSTAHLLATLRSYLHGDLPEIDSALRTDSAELDSLTQTRLTAALQHLPVHHGAAYAISHATGVDRSAYPVGEIVVEPAFIRCDLEPPVPRHNDPAPYPTCLAIWSATGRRAKVLETGTNAVVFTAGTSFLVLDVTGQETPGELAVVFLAEAPRRPLRLTDTRAEQILAHLRVKVGTAVAVPAVTSTAGSISPGALQFFPGLDDTGHPYRPDPA